MRVPTRSRGHLSALPDAAVLDELRLRSTVDPRLSPGLPDGRRSGPALLLLHGIGDSSQAWLPVLAQLARTHTVIAPDLLGHGGSDKPRADYSVAAYANGMRDLLGALDVDRVTVVGHSLGGGVAMQFAYQFPDRTERLVLVGAGGAGRELNPLLRLVSAPLADQLLACCGCLVRGCRPAWSRTCCAGSGPTSGLDSADFLRRPARPAGRASRAAPSSGRCAASSTGAGRS